MSDPNGSFNPQQPPQGQSQPQYGQYPPQGYQPQPQYGQYAPQGQPMPPQFQPQQERPQHHPDKPNLGAWLNKPLTLKIWQFSLSLIGAAVAGVILLFAIALAVSPAGSNTAGSEEKPSTTSQNAEQKSEEKKESEPKEKVIYTLTVKYEGSKDLGTEINESTPGLTLTVLYSDGTLINNAKGFTIQNPGPLQSGDNTFTVEYEGKTSTFTITVEETDNQFKASAQDIPFEDLARNPDSQKGKRVHLRGEIVQVIEGTTSTQYRISMQQDEYGYWDSDKVVFVDYPKKTTDNRLLEDDIVEVWGTAQGTITYQSTLGGNITIPSIEARIMQLSQ